MTVPQELAIVALSKPVPLFPADGSPATDLTLPRHRLPRPPPASSGLPTAPWTHVRIVNLHHHAPKDYRGFNEITPDHARLTNVRELQMGFTTNYDLEAVILDLFLRTTFPRITRLGCDFWELDMRDSVRMEDAPAAVPPQSCAACASPGVGGSTIDAALHDLSITLSENLPLEMIDLSLHQNLKTLKLSDASDGDTHLG
ncbi:hypothetical protein K438DRAFT_1969914 [Mycena galopus ATCC 62051]|nr:hypothetical protein K438DRAFT_1969914 [Mycena galopus ATCC 62051]